MSVVWPYSDKLDLSETMFFKVATITDSAFKFLKFILKLTRSKLGAVEFCSIDKCRIV